MTPTENDKWKCFVIGIALFLLQFAGTAMAADSWAGYPDSAFAGGSGTKDDPWQIATPQQLAYLAQQVNTGTGTPHARCRLMHQSGRSPTMAEIRLTLQPGIHSTSPIARIA